MRARYVFPAICLLYTQHMRRTQMSLRLHENDCDFQAVGHSEIYPDVGPTYAAMGVELRINKKWGG